MSRLRRGKSGGSRKGVGQGRGAFLTQRTPHPPHTYVACDARSTYIYLPTISRYCVCNGVPGAAAATGIARVETTRWWCIIAIMRATSAASDSPRRALLGLTARECQGRRRCRIYPIHVIYKRTRHYTYIPPAADTAFFNSITLTHTYT